MEHLIESVRKYPCLWNTAAIEYRDQELKDAAWAEVMKDTELSSVKEVKLKWKKLRDSYRDALKRQSELALKQEGGGRRPYPWKYMAHMAFLQPHMGARRRAEPPDAETNGRAPEPPPAPARSRSRSSASSDSSSGPPPARRRRPPPAPAPTLPLPPAAPLPQQPDPLDIFFSSMCQATKRLGFGAQLKVKRAVFEAVTAAEEALLAEQASLAALWARAPDSSSDEAPPP